MVLAEGKKKKMLATLVGCNYAGTGNDLQGCINDVHAMRRVLLDRFGFAPDDINMLTDDDPENLPTGAAIKRALSDMIARAAPGDVLLFHFSGHGTEDARVHGKEAIFGSDFNLITDVDFQDLLHRVPQGATFTMVSDSCYSGGLFDEEKEQVGPAAGAGAGHRGHRRADAVHTGSRFIPYDAVVAHLSGMSGLDASHHVGDHLVAIFGADASPKFHSHRHDDHHGRRSSSSNSGAHAGILLSGSQKNETSTDLQGEAPCGAFTYSLLDVLKAHPAPVSNKELVRRTREVVVRAIVQVYGKEQFEENPQHPCLYCSDANADAPFLGEQDTSKAKSN